MKELLNKIKEQAVYHNDLIGKLWSYDFKHKGKWVENIAWKGDMTEVTFTYDLEELILRNL